jgi:hypothetical protein
MTVLDGNFVPGCGPGTDYQYIHLFQYMLERTDAITNKVLKPITFVLAHPTVRLLDLGTEQYVGCNHCERKLTDVASVRRSDKHFVGFSSTASTELAHAIVTAVDNHSYH